MVTADSRSSWRGYEADSVDEGSRDKWERVEGLVCLMLDL